MSVADVTAHGRARWRKAVEAGCDGPQAREVVKAVKAGSRRQETVASGAEPVKVDEEGAEPVKVDEEGAPV